MRRSFVALILFAASFTMSAQGLPSFGSLAKENSDIADLPTQWGENGLFVSTFALQYCSDNWFDEYIWLDEISEPHKVVLFDMYRSIGDIENVYAFSSHLSPSFAVNSAQDTCILAGCYFYNVIFNTFVTSELRRATDTFTDAALPILENITPFLEQMGFPYVMLGVGYECRDFREETEDAEGACVFYLFKLKDLLDFFDLEITVRELFEDARVYVREGSEPMKRLVY